MVNECLRVRLFVKSIAWRSRVRCVAWPLLCGAVLGVAGNVSLSWAQVWAPAQMNRTGVTRSSDSPTQVNVAQASLIPTLDRTTGDRLALAAAADEGAMVDCGLSCACHCSNVCGGATCTRPWDSFLQGWVATKDLLVLDRSTPSAQALAVNTNNANQNFNASDLDFRVQIGADVTLQRLWDCGWGIEARYFGMDDWHSSAAAVTTANDLLRINAAVPVFTTSGTGINGGYDSSLHNAEINARRRLTEDWTLLAGFRYAELDERLGFSLSNSPISTDYEVSVRNRLYGFQMGGVARLLTCRQFRVDAWGKAGVFDNVLASDSALRTPAVLPGVHGRQNRTAFMGETGVNATLTLTHHIALRSGYRLLWVDGVALASDQLSANDFVLSTGWNSSGNVLYQGGFAGLEFAY